MAEFAGAPKVQGISQGQKLFQSAGVQNAARFCVSVLRLKDRLCLASLRNGGHLLKCCEVDRGKGKFLLYL